MTTIMMDREAMKTIIMVNTTVVALIGPNYERTS